MIDRQIEVFRNPLDGESGSARYGQVRILKPGESVAPPAAEGALIAVVDLLP